MLSKINVPTFVKWAGGKTQLLEQFKTFYPTEFNRYFEPFLGSGAVFFFIKQKYKSKSFYLSDINKELINCYKVVRDKPDELIELLKWHKENHMKSPKSYYYDMRSRDPSAMSYVEAAARLIYLNKTCFNGLYRVNSKGKFNVPIGSYKNPGIVNEKVITEASILLQGVDINVEPFEKVLDRAKSGDFVYFDPPYFPITKTASFTAYTQNSFSEEDQKRLAAIFDKLNAKGCYVMLSNSDHPMMKKLYVKYMIGVVKAGRVICCDPSKRGKINELVITNYLPNTRVVSGF